MLLATLFEDGFVTETFSVAGLVSWDEVPSLPFELACLPQALFRFLRLPVVSYALPALIAIGQAVYHHRPPRNPPQGGAQPCGFLGADLFDEMTEHQIAATAAVERICYEAC